MSEKDIVESERPERTPPLQAPAIALAFGSLLGLAVIAVLLTLVGYQIVLPNGSSEWSDAWGCWLADLDSNTVAQIVPSIVVAIFVFAVGTAFVVAQVVPPARGSRATTTLQGRRMARAIAPAPALIVGSVLAVLVSDNIVAGSISVAILVGSFIYLLISLWAMLTILFDATDPVRFKALLLKKATEAANCLANNPPCKRVGYLIRPPDKTPILSRNTGQHGRQAATDALYEIVRTARGWVRVAARSNDSRELHESLQCLLSDCRHLCQQGAWHCRTECCSDGLLGVRETTAIQSLIPIAGD